jgi:hypothetical protein
VAADTAIAMKDREKISSLKTILIDTLGAAATIEIREKLDRVPVK